MAIERTSVLAGETKRRGLLSGRQSKGKTAALIVWGFATAALVLFLQVPGLLVGAAGFVLIFLATMDLDVGVTVWSKWQARRRMALRRRLGFDDFVPFELMPPGLEEGPTAAGSKARKAWSAQYARYREVPDGVDGLQFLEARPRRPAVAYHAGRGEQAYLSVTFAVDGPIQGLQGDAYVAQAQMHFGDLLAGWGGVQKIVTGLQITTRVIPSDSAMHEVWLERQMDPAAPEGLKRSYAELLDTLADASFVQRHFVTVRWDLSDRFITLAASRGEGAAGWLELVMEQLDSVMRRLATAGFVKVSPLSGPRLGAVLRHLQHPDWPIDRASDVNVAEGLGATRCWLPSHDEASWTEVVSASPDPLDPTLMLEPSSWHHRTCEVPPKAMEHRDLDGLWMAPLITSFEHPLLRTISTHIHLQPAQTAKAGARQDATSDAAEIAGQRRKGKIIDDESETALTASQRRYADLRSGGGHHGATWRMFVTISCRNRDDLLAATEQINEAGAAASIDRFDWFDSLHSTAQAFTWPLARAVTPEKQSAAVRAASQLAKDTKESIAA